MGTRIRLKSAPTSSSPLASIIVPAYKEVGNVRPLVKRVFSSLEGTSTWNRNSVEMIFVDDNSGDGTEGEVKKLAEEGYPVRIIVRTKDRGLSSAVIRGFTEAEGELLLCMDADLQHPPEKVPELLDKLKQEGVEFVIGTRYGKGDFAVDKDWPMYRRVISQGARLMARLLSPLSDPMTGFFGIRKAVFARGTRVDPIGFKIALELYVKCGCSKLAEVPIVFGMRTAGESKLSGKVIVKYVQQLWQLYLYKFPLLLPIVLILMLAMLCVLFYYSNVWLS